MRPVFHYVRLGEVVVDSFFVKFGLFVEAKVQRPAFVSESGIGDGVLGCNEVEDVGFGDVVGNDVVLGDGGETRE